MRMLTCKILNVMKISELEIDTTKNHLLLIGGKNGQGKTSALMAFLMVLCGKRGMDWPDVPLKEGEDHGECVLTFELADDGSDNDMFPDMQSLTVRRTWDRERDGSIKETLTITDESGQRSASPQQILNDLFKNRAFNPMSLELLDQKKQREVLMDLVGLSQDYATKMAERQEAFEARAVITKQGQQLAAQVAGMLHYDDAPDAEVSLSSLVSELQEAEKANDTVKVVRTQALCASDAYKAAIEDVDRKKKSLAEAEARVVDAKQLAKELEDKAAKSSFIETDEIRARIDSVEEENAQVRANQRYEEAQSQLEALREQRDEQHAIVERIPDELQEMLGNADWPIDELSVDDEGVLYRGLPVLQASRAERIRLWCRVAAALNPKLRLLIFPDGNDLDYTSMQELDDFLAESDFQAVVEFVTRNTEDEERCVVVLEDGHARVPVAAV
jgi:hypothetical protein